MNATVQDSLGRMSGEQLLVLRILEGDAALAAISSELDRRARKKFVGVGSMRQATARVPGRRLFAAV